MSGQFLAWALATPWALQPERLSAYAALLAQRYATGRIDTPTPDAAVKRAGNPRQGSIAVVPVYGTIMQRASQLDMCTGGTSTEAISKALRDANADESVASILLDIDSPGGSVYGVSELAAEIRASRKPVTAVANSLAASAAYWLGTAAAELYVTPGGEVGSIGVWQAHEDWSQALAEQGVQVTLISAGKYKTEGHPYGPLPEDARAFLQQRTDEYYAAFTRDVAKGRRVSVDAVRNGMGQGRVLGATQAVTEGMVDGIMTMDQVIKRMQAGGGRSAAERRATSLRLLDLG